VYQTSGESAAIELMARENLIRREAANLETWTAFVRAGASIIITYDARHARTWLEK
jgi:porphobilinogen synthase